jgi:hypothetical protein
MNLSRRLRRHALVLAVALTGLAAPASASALQLHIVNESGRPSSEVFVDIAGSEFNVEGAANDQPVALSDIPNQEVTINKLISGRVYVSYGSPVAEGVPFNSPTRFDWAELTVTPVPEDAANLTAVNQFGIGMRLTTLGQMGEPIDSVGSTYSNTIFAALQQIPGGPESTIRNSKGEIVRVLSPDTPGSAYAPLTEYVHSMAGQTITLHTAFFGTPFTTSEYSGEFQPDGSITLEGTKNEGKEAKDAVPAPPISVSGPELIEDIYTGGTGPNDLERAVLRDLFSGFSVGLWGGRYGNDASAFCTNYNTTPQGSWCPTGFNVPAFAEARTTPAPFPAYEQYAAVINQFSDVYGNPYSDASKKVQVTLDQPHVKTLQLTILPDSPPAEPTNTGSGNGPAKTEPVTPAKPPATNHKKGSPKVSRSQVSFALAFKSRLKHGKLSVGRLSCSGACGKVVGLLQPKHGKGVLAREVATIQGRQRVLVLKTTKLGERVLSQRPMTIAILSVTATQPGHKPARRHGPLRVYR